MAFVTGDTLEYDENDKRVTYYNSFEAEYG